MAYELIALDMDGTLLTRDKRLLDETVRDIDAAAALGKETVLCTGRCVPELAPYRARLSSVRYAVTVSGAVVYDLRLDRAVFDMGIDRELVLKIVAVADKYGATAHLMAADASVLPRDKACRAADFGMGPYQELYTTVPVLVDDVAAEAAARPYVPKVNVYFRSPDDRDKAYEALRTLPLTIAFAEAAGLEMSPPGVTKATGLQWLAARLGLGMEQVVAVGDADNDRSMLAAAGLAVAVGNAEPEVLAMADAVVADCDHNGAGQAIRRFLMG